MAGPPALGRRLGTRRVRIGSGPTPPLGLPHPTPGPLLRERTACGDWRALRGVDDARRRVCRALIGPRRRGRGRGARPDCSAREAVSVPGSAARRGEGDHAECSAGHRGQQVRRLRRPRRRVGGRGEQQEQGRTTAGARPREGASPALPRRASREPRSLCPRVPAAPDAGVRRPEPLSDPCWN